MINKTKLTVSRGLETINVYQGHMQLVVIPIRSRDPLAVYRSIVSLYETQGYSVNEHLDCTKFKGTRTSVYNLPHYVAPNKTK